MIKSWVRSGIAVMAAISIVLIPNTFAGNTAAAATVYDTAAQQAQETADVLTTLYGVTSVQYALIDEGEIVISGQSGVYSKNDTAKPTNENMYGIGSVSKMFTAAAVMQLAEQGKISLDASVAKYIPEFEMADKRYKSITVRMLLNHSSGIMGSTLSNAMLFDDNDTVGMDTLLKELKAQRLKADPGEFSVYCNDGFSLAQLLVEKVSGVSFSEYIRTNITEPLAITNTKTPLDDFSRTKLVKTYLAGSDTALPTENVNAIGAGGIYSTAEDLCRFADIFMYGSDDEVLSDASSEEMAKNEYLSGIWWPEDDSSLSYGLGWDSVNTYPFTQYGIKALVKGGDTSLFHGSLIVLPEEKLAMAVLSSGGSSVYDQAMAQEVLLKALLAKGSIAEVKADKTFTAPVKAPMPADEKKNAGYYAYTGGVVRITISDDGVLNLYDGTQLQQFIYTGDGSFTFTDGSTRVSFEKEDNGSTYLYVHGYVTLPYLGQIASAAYQVQKIKANPLSAKVKAAWEKREGKLYFLLNEKYSSETYLSLPAASIAVEDDGIEGYCQSAAIIDADTARMQLQIPGPYGRDLSDLTFYTQSKTEYLKYGAAVYVSGDAVKALSTKNTFTVTIGTKGYAQWYTIGAKSKNKSIKVTLPKNASFTVYDASGICTFSSLTAGTAAAVLPEKGYIVFAGNKGAEFTVKYVK